MRTIHQLSQQVISKIAAGEVIERPAYAVKELIDNAIDAKADYIIINIEESGLKKISVTDNGTGIHREDLLEAYKPHTTSKLTTEEELIGIKSLGFRGEALSSISAISTLTMQSKLQTEREGVEVKVKHGIVEKISPVGIPSGTTMIVEQLFQNVPVRKKFLRSQATEFRHIIEIVTQYALAFPHVRFFLTHNKKTIFDLPKTQTLEDRIKMLLGKDLLEYLVPISREDPYLSISGYLAKPQITTTTTSKQFIFVNTRRVHDKFITSAIKAAYGNLLEKSTYPIFILFLTMPFEGIDVNIHPRKDKVNFLNKNSVIETIHTYVKDTLEQKNITYKTLRWKGDPLYDQKTKKLFSIKSGFTNSIAGNMLKDTVTPWNSRTEILEKNLPIEQLHNLYIIAQTTNGMIMIDQHAAHERILFEQYFTEFKKKKQLFSSYVLKNPEFIELSISDGELLIEYEELINNMGFSIKHELENQYSIYSVPQFLQDRDRKIYIRELLDSLSEEQNFDGIDTQTKKMIAYLACRSAIKAGEKLTKKQMLDVLKKLEETKNNITCPHGRPTKVTVSLAEINRLFKR